MTNSGEQPPIDDEWSKVYAAAAKALNTPSGWLHLPATVVMRLVTEVRRLRDDQLPVDPPINRRLVADRILDPTTTITDLHEWHAADRPLCGGRLLDRSPSGYRCRICKWAALSDKTEANHG